MSMNCHEKASYFVKDGWGRTVARPWRVEVSAVSDILLDTGCTRTMVRSDLVGKKNLIPGEAVTVLCAHGDTALYPLARITINMEGIEMEVEAVVSDSLPVSVFLGTDTTQLGQLFRSNPRTVRSSGFEQALVTTRGQARREAEDEQEQQTRETLSGVRPHQLTGETCTQDRREELWREQGKGGTESAEQDEGVEAEQNLEEAEEERCEEMLGDDEEGNFVAELADVLFLRPTETRKQTRAARRRERHAHGLERAKEGRVSSGQGLDGGLHLTRTKLQQLQEANVELAKIAVKEGFYR